jgi:hypothetical protein
MSKGASITSFLGTRSLGTYQCNTQDHFGVSVTKLGLVLLAVDLERELMSFRTMLRSDKVYINIFRQISGDVNILSDY